MTTWKAFKLKAEDEFKKEHAKELLNAHKDGVTGFPLKFEKGLSPVLDKLAAAQKNKKDKDIQTHTAKAKEIIGIYQGRIDNGATKKVLGDHVHKILDDGLTAIRSEYHIPK